MLYTRVTVDLAVDHAKVVILKAQIWTLACPLTFTLTAATDHPTVSMCVAPLKLGSLHEQYQSASDY